MDKLSYAKTNEGFDGNMNVISSIMDESRLITHELWFVVNQTRNMMFWRDKSKLS